MYHKIKNPENGRNVSIHGKVGQRIFRNYLNMLQQKGGFIRGGVRIPVDNYLDTNVSCNSQSGGSELPASTIASDPRSKLINALKEALNILNDNPDLLSVADTSAADALTNSLAVTEQQPNAAPDSEPDEQAEPRTDAAALAAAHAAPTTDGAANLEVRADVDSVIAEAAAKKKEAKIKLDAAIDEHDKALAAAPAAVAAEAVAAEAEAEVASAAPNSNMSNQEESQLGQTDGADED